MDPFSLNSNVCHPFITHTVYIKKLGKKCVLNFRFFLAVILKDVIHMYDFDDHYVSISLCYTISACTLST